MHDYILILKVPALNVTYEVPVYVDDNDYMWVRGRKLGLFPFIIDLERFRLRYIVVRGEIVEIESITGDDVYELRFDGRSYLIKDVMTVAVRLSLNYSSLIIEGYNIFVYSLKDGVLLGFYSDFPL